jgi:molybdate transport system regulatory protein
MKVHTKIWLETDSGESLMGEGNLAIFKAIESKGSLSAAARELGMSYRALWGKVRKAEKRFGLALVNSTVGGSKHGGAVLTDDAFRLVDQYSILEKRARQAVNQIAQGIFEEIKTSDEDE